MNYVKKKSIKKNLYNHTYFIYYVNYIFKNNNLIETEYVSNLNTSHLYLLNEDNYLVKVDFLLTKDKLEDNIKLIINELSVNNKKYLPLKGLIPSNTNLNNIKLEDKTCFLDFSNDLLKVNKNLEEKVIESIVYSLIELNEIDNVKISINNVPLTKLEKSNKSLPVLLNNTFGINKSYEINKITDIEKVVIYYVFNEKEHDYYVPVTKYVNSKDSNVKIIIDSLKGSFSSNTNLRSYLSKQMNIDFKIDQDILTLTFDNLNEDTLEQVTYSLASSIFDSMDIEKVIFEVNSKVVDIKEKK